MIYEVEICTRGKQKFWTHVTCWYKRGALRDDNRGPPDLVRVYLEIT
jgi:hypothetical protein